MEVRVALSDREHPIVVSLPSRATAQDLDTAVRNNVQYEAPAGARLRFIKEGKVLAPASHTVLADMGVFNGSILLCMISECCVLREPHHGIPETKDVFNGRTCDRIGVCVDREATEMSGPCLSRLSDEDRTHAESARDDHGIACRPLRTRRLDDQVVILDDVEDQDSEGEEFEDGSEDGTWYDWGCGFGLGLMFGVILLALAYDRTFWLTQKWHRGLKAGVAGNVLIGALVLLWQESGAR